MKRIFSLLLACILLLQAVPMTTFAVESDLSAISAEDGVAAVAQDYNNVTITTEAELRTLAKKAASASGTYYVYYQGSEDLVISQNLTLPQNLHLYLGLRKLVVNKGVTFRTGYYLTCGNMEVKGTAHTYLTHAWNGVTITGKLYLHGGFYVHNNKTSVVTGEENIVFGDGQFEFWMDARTTEEMLTNLKQVKASPNAHYRFRMQPVGDFVFTKTVTLPENCYMVSYTANSVTVNSGCTLTINNVYYVQKPLTIKGKLVNNAQLSLLKYQGEGTVTVKSGGSYTGNGNIFVDAALKPSEVITGLNLKNHFEVQQPDGILFRSPAWSRTEVTVKNTASTGKVKLSWTQVYGAEKYQIYRATGKDGDYELLKTTGSTSYTTGGSVGKKYYYKVRSVSNTDDKSVFSEVVSGTRDLPRPEVTAKNVSSTGKIKLSWEKVAGAVKYEVYRATSKTGTYKLLKTTTSTSYTASGTAGKTYYFKVKAIHKNSTANSAYSAVVSCVRDLPRPEVTVKLKNGDPRLSWDEVEGAVKYTVYRAASKDGKYKAVKNTGNLTWTDTTVKAGKTYYYKVKAIHAKSSASSAYSPVVKIKTK